MKVSIIILAVTILLTTVVAAVLGRYDYLGSEQGKFMIRADRWTGVIEVYCNGGYQSTELRCNDNN